MRQLAFLGLLGWAVLQATAAKVTIDNLSPQIEYWPPLIGDTDAKGEVAWQPNRAENAWNTTFTTVPRYFRWDLVHFRQPHYSWAKFIDDPTAPTMEVSFVGTGIELLGPDPKPIELGKSAVHLQVDDSADYEMDCSESADATPFRCGFSDMPFKRHTLKVTLKSGKFAVGSFEIETGKDEDETPEVLDCALGKDKINRDGPHNLKMQGQWSAVDESTGGEGQEVVYWNRVVAQTKDVGLSVSIPKGTVRVEMWGAVDIDHNLFSIRFDPPAYGLTAYTGNAFNLYTVQNMTMYDTMLDPKVNYTVTVENLRDAYLDVSQFKFYKAAAPAGGSAHSGGGLSAGAIAGIVIGSIAAMGAAGLLVWLCLRRRKEEDIVVDMESDSGEIQYPVEPYTDSDVNVASGLRAPALVPMSYAGAGTGTGTPPGVAGVGAHHSLAHPNGSQSHSGSGSTSEPLLGLSPTNSSGLSPFTVNNPDDAGYAAASSSTVGIAALDAKVQPRPVTYHHVQHTDGGIAAPQAPATADVVVTEAPPVYNPDWAGWGSRSGSGSGPTASASSPSDGENARRGEKSPVTSWGS